MFEKATKKLVRQIDRHGVLIATSSLNDSKNLQPLAVVLKCQKTWFWQRTKYRPTRFTLNDLLQGKPIKPVCEQNKFVSYEETCRNSMTGSVEVGSGTISLNANGKGASKFQLSLGTLCKEDVNIPKLHRDCSGRKVDFRHSLIQQSLQQNKAFTILTERIYTTCKCTIAYSGLEEGSCFTALGACCAEIFIQDSAKLQYESKVAIEIPPNTVMAYSVIEMSISTDGYFDLYVGPSGIEADDTSQNSALSFSEVDGPWAVEEIHEGSPLSTLKKTLAGVQVRFCALADLSSQCHTSLLQLLRQSLMDRPVLSALMDWLEKLSSGESKCLSINEWSDTQSQIIGSFLDVLKCEPFNISELITTPESSTALSSQNGSQISTPNHGGLTLVPGLNGSSPQLKEENGCHTAKSDHNGCSTKTKKQRTQLLTAMHMLISALDELTDAGLAQLEHFWTSEGLKSLQDLVNLLTANNMPLSKDTLPVFFQKEDEFHKVLELFKSCNVLLRREDNILSAEITSGEGFLPLVLCIAINGLASLNA